MKRDVIVARNAGMSPVLAKASGDLPGLLVWMPAGAHQISAGRADGGRFDGLVRCDELGASAVSASFTAARLAGRRVWIDQDHDNGAAVADVRRLEWSAGLGIVAAIDWTPLGERLLRERQFFSFSPTFWVDWESGRVSGIVEGLAAGALCNSPAFGGAMPPLITAAAAFAGFSPGGAIAIAAHLSSPR